MRTWLDAELGRIFDDGVEKEILGGLNFIGFTIERDDANNRYNITSPTDALDSDDIDNVSAVTGATVTAALNTLNTAVGLRALAATTITAGAGLTGGGDLSASRTINVVAADGTITVNADSIQVGTLTNTNYPTNTMSLSKLVNASAQFQIVARKTSSGGAWEDCSRSELGLALSATTISAGTNLSGGGDLSTNRTISMSATPTGLTSINGAAPLAPVEGTVLADADANIIATDGSQIRIPTLTANRTYDINNTSAVDEETIVLYRSGTEAFTATIRDHADATIATFPASTKLLGVFRKATGANFVFVGFQRIA